jgi:parallel beta-helix repeat protein
MNTRVRLLALVLVLTGALLSVPSAVATGGHHAGRTGMATALKGRAAASPGALRASAARTIVVNPGQSIQAAIDRANPGDTVLIKPGHYRESVLVAKNNLRIRGSGTGPGGTVITPAATPHGPCGTQGSGICVFDPNQQRTIVGTRVDSLEVRGFPQDGVVGVATRGFIVRNVKALNNGRYGITKFASSGGQFIHNVATGSADAGIYVGDSPNANTFIAGNEVSNSGFGILVRNAENASIQFNDVHNNCIGIFVWWLPGTAGESDISFNTSEHNNKFCAGEDEVGFDYSGSGIALLGAHDTVVANNTVLANRGSTRVSGGIVLVSGESDGGPPSNANSIRDNTAFKDAPADIIDLSGGTNTFLRNFCSRSTPGGLCQS